MRVTECDCDAAGWCPRHRCTKLPFHWELCRRRQDFFDLWEEGRGPRQAIPVVQPLQVCRNRSETAIDQVACATCGGRQVLVPIYACGLFGRCSERSFGLQLAEVYQALSCPQCSSRDVVPSRDVVSSRDVVLLKDDTAGL